MPATHSQPITTSALRWITPDTERRTTVNAHARLRLHLAQQHRQADLLAAAYARILRAQRTDRDRTIRTRIGRTIIRLGERLAAEPPFEPARPR